MTKLLVSGHWHLRDSCSVNRKDNFFETQFNHVEWVLKLAESEKVDAIVHCGDVFHKWNVGYGVVERLTNLLQAYRPCLYTIAGSHDLEGHQIENTAFSLMTSLKFFKHFTKVDIGLCTLHAIPLGIYQDGSFDIEERLGCAFNFIVTHYMLVPNPVPFPHTLLKDVKTNARLVIGSDVHPPYSEGKFLNPGCLNRWSIGEKNIQPIAFIIECNEGKEIFVRTFEVPCDDEIFEEREEKAIEEVQSSINTTSIDSFELSEVLGEIIKNESKEVQDHCHKLLKEASAVSGFGE